MQLSYYTIIVEGHPGPGEHLLYNTRTQALVKINDELRTLLSDLSVPEDSPLRQRYAGELEQLHGMGVLVENKWEDVKRLVYFIGNLKHGKLNSSLSVTILTTMACNFRCTYCFEEPSRQNVAMDPNTCEAVLRWLKETMTREDYRSLYLTFYGGEPLMNEPAIEHIALDMAGWCAAHGMTFKFMLQTNGYLLTSGLVKKYLACGLADVRISLDGVGEDHDRKRPLRDGRGTFDRIMENISDNVDSVKIGLSVSYDRAGVDHIARLLDYLDDRKILKKLARIVCSPVHAALGAPGEVESTRNAGCLMNCSDSEMATSVLEVNRLMEKKGLPVQKGMPVTVCPLGRVHGGVTIDSAGQLYACNSMLGHPELSVGNVRDGFNDKRREFIDLDVGLKCPFECRYLPVCNGGCRFMAFLGTGRMDAPDCKKEYLDRVAPEFIKNEYAALTRQADAGPAAQRQGAGEN
jgi:uncharacterized protein